MSDDERMVGGRDAADPERGGPPCHALLDRFREHLARHRLFQPRGTVLVAVSGGPDSVALLDLLRDVAPGLGLDVVCAHVDHGIHPRSGDVAATVTALATRLGVPFRMARLDLGADASETAARRARYRALRQMQEETGARYLATAHHADDQVETVLLRLLRGSGVAGLAGIPRRGPGGLVRPLLPFTRAELAEWVASRDHVLGEGFAVHDDPANRDPRHDRSWLRAEVLPLLERRRAGLRRRILETATDAARDRLAWRAALRALPGLELARKSGTIEVARAPFRGYDPTLGATLLRALARQIGWTLGTRPARRALSFVMGSSSGHRLDLGAGRAVELAFDRVRLVARPAASSPTAQEIATEHGALVWRDVQFRWREEPAGDSTRRAWVAWITPGAWSLRPPLRGERLRPLGGVGRREVRRLLMEARVPAADRAAYPVVARGGAALWVPGVCRAAADVPPPGSPAVRIEAVGPG